MLAIEKAKYIGDYNIHLCFNDGREGVADLKKTIFEDRRPIFSELKEKSNFSSFRIAHGTIVWPNRLDLAPEYLFYLTFREDNHYQEQFRRWGYQSSAAPQASSFAPSQSA
ncbi:MAG: DUF2442 domain-containing protein [Gammaproteobacteria bacterium]|nr:DUF2442 domain-containing protein [Gammaproteobacteria bacterium]NNJ84313.1 DUF2442 domain-containing protein [Gammaproteobacteria bacterium]